MKKILSIAAIASLALVACTKASEYEDTANPLPVQSGDAVVAAQGIEITPKTSYVVVGETVSLSVAFQPEGSVEGLSWTSSDENVATVDNSGVVTTKAVGIARVSAVAEGGATATALVNVFAERIPATEIKLNKETATIRVGQFTQIRAFLLPDGSEEGVPGTTDQLDIEWVSSDESVATVSYGLVRALAEGTVTITAKQGDLTKTCEITVNPKAELVDKASVWTITDTPHWNRDWWGKISGSYEDVTLEGCDAVYHVFAVVAADKFTSVEELAADYFLKVDEAREAGQDPASMFSKEASQTTRYSDLGPAVAYALGFSEDFDFTGEYVLYEFEARTPDPVHATGVKFRAQSGWDYADVTALTLKEGKSTRVQLQLLPEDCTDTGSITLEPADPAMLSVAAYYPDYYENQFTVTALAEGTTKLIAKFNNVVSELEVTITSSNITLTDHSSTWKATKTSQEQYGWTIVNINVTVCDAARFYATVTNDKPQGTTLKSTLASMAEGVYSYNIRSEVPAEFQSWDGDGRYIVILGFDGSGEFTGDYAIIDTEGGSEPGGDEPGPVDPVAGKRIKFGDVVFRAELPASRATSEEGTLEAWVYATSTGGCQNIAGSESNFLLRIDSGQLDYVYGGAIDSRGEVAEAHVRASITVNEWHHVVATYKQNGQAILYVDGDKVGSANTEDHPVYMDGKTKNDGNYPCWGYPFRFYIGSGSDKHDYSGSLAYLRVYDRVISADEVADLMYTEDVSDSALIGYWKFNEGSGNQITDYSGNGITLTAKKALTGGASGSEPALSDGTVTWEDGDFPY
ncbi:MAG: Ig-like domain-containing protein [Bacteroidales bacterium]|nr:Ig-like domain-containing protein [Bacteroidales bacterium]